MEDGLFALPEPTHPDEVVAHEEIGRYYADQVTEARQALADAQAKLAKREEWLEAWTDRREITPDVVGSTDMAPVMISAASTGRYQAACQPLLRQMEAVAGRVVNRAPNAPQMRAEAERLGDREKALRRWLTAKGHDLGALAEPPTEERRSRRTGL